MYINGVNNMYRIQVWFDSHWKWGLHDYTEEQAIHRMNRLKSVGIKCRMRPSRELFD